MKTPGKEKHQEQMVYIPKPFKVFPTRFLKGRKHHGHQCNQHDVPGCAGAGTKIDDKPAFESEVFGHGETGKVYPMGDGVEPGEEDD